MTWEVCLQEDPLKHSNVNVQMKPICSYERLRFLTKGLVTQKMAKALVKMSLLWPWTNGKTNAEMKEMVSPNGNGFGCDK